MSASPPELIGCPDCRAVAGKPCQGAQGQAVGAHHARLALLAEVDGRQNGE